MDITSFYGKAAETAALFDAFARRYQLSARLRADHIGYKCSSREEFEVLRALFEPHSDFIYQSIIGKRRIDVVKLVQPIASECGPIFYLELSDQKPDGSQKGDFDHLECYPEEDASESVAAYLADQGVQIRKADRPHHVTYDTVFAEGLAFRIEPEPLMEKIVRDEINIKRS